MWYSNNTYQDYT